MTRAQMTKREKVDYEEGSGPRNRWMKKFGFAVRSKKVRYHAGFVRMRPGLRGESRFMTVPFQGAGKEARSGVPSFSGVKRGPPLGGTLFNHVHPCRLRQ